MRVSKCDTNTVFIAHFLWEQSETLNGTIRCEYMNKSLARHCRVQITDPKRPGRSLNLPRSIISLGGDGATGEGASRTQKRGTVAVWETDGGRRSRTRQVELVGPQSGLGTGDDIESGSETRGRCGNFTVSVRLATGGGAPAGGASGSIVEIGDGNGAGSGGRQMRRLLEALVD